MAAGSLVTFTFSTILYLLWVRLQVQVVRYHCEDDGACFGGLFVLNAVLRGGRAAVGVDSHILVRLWGAAKQILVIYIDKIADYISKYSREDMQAQIREPEAKEAW